MAQQPGAIPAETIDALRTDSLSRLNLSGKKLTDNDAFQLAGVLRGNRAIRAVDLHDNQISDAGMAALAEPLARLPNLVTLHLGNNEFGNAGRAAVEAAFRAMQPKNLSRLTGLYPIGADMGEGPLHFELTFPNGKKIRDLREVVYKPETFTPQAWLDTALRLPAMQENASSEGDKADIANFEQFLDSLPRTDPSKPQAAISALVEGQYDPDDKTVFNNPRTWLELPETIAGLNREGLYLHADALLIDGEPSPLLQRACETGNLPALFTEQNWRGAPATELRGVLRVIPEEFRCQLPNIHALKAAVNQNHGLAR